MISLSSHHPRNLPEEQTYYHLTRSSQFEPHQRSIFRHDHAQAARSEDIWSDSRHQKELFLANLTAYASSTRELVDDSAASEV
jgi:hypothetical protein